MKLNSDQLWGFTLNCTAYLILLRELPASFFFFFFKVSFISLHSHLAIQEGHKSGSLGCSNLCLSSWFLISSNRKAFLPLVRLQSCVTQGHTLLCFTFSMLPQYIFSQHFDPVSQNIVTDHLVHGGLCGAFTSQIFPRRAR